MNWTIVACALLIGACNDHVDLGTNARDDSGLREVASDEAVSDAAAGDTLATADGDLPSEVAAEAAVDVAPCVPPTFAGLSSIDEVTEVSVTLHWASATHPTAAPEDIIYEIFVAAPPVDPFTPAPAYGVVKGTTSFVAIGLVPSRAYSFGVRAIGPDGCRDANVVVQTASTLQDCRFAPQIQPILDRNCAVAGCHVLPTPPEGMVLSSGFSYSNLVGVVSSEAPPMLRVAPGDPENSYLYRKITGRPATGTNLMPPPGATSLLTSEEKDRIKCWIDRGANP